MAKFVYGLNQSLDGYVDHMKIGRPRPEVFDHFVKLVREQAGFLYGRVTYDIMRYWEDDQDGWDAEDHEFAALWRSKPKWVVSRSLQAVGPNATLVEGDLETAMRELKARIDGEIGVAGPHLAKSLGDLGLVDEYRLYLHPIVLGGGTPFFVGTRPPLRLVNSDLVIGDMIRLAYAPA